MPTKRVRSGYKLTPCGEIPQDWDCVRLKDVALSFLNGGTPSRKCREYWHGGTIPWITGAELEDRLVLDPRRMITQQGLDESATNLVPKGAILVATRTGIGKIARAPFDVAISQDLTAIVAKKKSCSEQYLMEAVSCGLRKLEVIAQGSTIAGILRADLENLHLAVPSPAEQKRIVVVLDGLSATLAKCKASLKQARNLRDKVVSSTFGRHPTATWPLRPIGSVVTPIRAPAKISPSTIYREIGIRSHGKGIFHKDSVRGERLGAKKVFWVQPGCLVLNIVFAWENAVAVTTEAENGMIASHRFPMFRPISSELNLGYLKHFIQSPRGVELLKMVSPGGAGRNKTLNSGDFLRLKIPVPTLPIQAKVVSALMALDSCIRYEEQLREGVELLYIELSRLLLTGKLRVKA